MCNNCIILLARNEDLEEKFKYLMMVNRELSTLLSKTSLDLYNFLENISHEQGLEEPAAATCQRCKDDAN